jgi:hypothetical protein
MIHFFHRTSSVIYLYVSLLIIGFSLAISCKKPIFNDEMLKFSYLLNNGDTTMYIIDTKLNITFDTVFTSIGSVTRHFLVHNTSNQELTIKSIYLAGGKQSMYSINVNGVSETSFRDITIPQKDSIFVFVKVNINPLNQNNPFLVTDSIVFITESQRQDVKLLAYGQDARYIVADQGPEDLRYKVVAHEHETVRWTKDRPYVVYGWAVIDSTGTLIIEPGTKVYFHNNSGLWAYRYSNLEVQGTLNEPVLFRGDRLEKWFDGDYAQWSRVWINEGAEVSIKNAVITNAFVGVQIEALPSGNELVVTPNVVKIENTIIKNTANSGVISRFLNLEMTNCLITNNGGYSLQLEGGNYTMKHLTVANYFWSKDRKTPTCYISNKVALYDNSPWDIDAKFTNCIIYGNYSKNGKAEPEIEINKDSKAELEVLFQNCLVKAEKNDQYFKECVHNEDPMFTDKDKPNKEKLNYTLQPSSPAIGKGKPIGVLLDILGNLRGNPPDIGAYEYVR